MDSLFRIARWADPIAVDPVIAVFLALPSIAWFLTARNQTVRWTIGLGLLGWVVLAVGIVSFFPRARAELTLAYFPVALVVIWIGRRWEGRKRRLPGPPSATWAAKLMLWATVLIVCVCGSFSFFAFNSEPFMPSTGELLPMPSGLHATDLTRDPLYSCGTAVCTRRFAVTGEAGQPVADVRDLVYGHLRERGWKLDAQGQDCHRAGWLLDRTIICVGVYIREGQVYVAFDGARAWS